MRSDTIFALASGPGRTAVAVVRLSGPASRSALETLTRAPCPAPRFARLASLYDPADGLLLDRALVLWFPAPASFTGEDCAELQLHGSSAVVSAVLSRLGALPGMRPAGPGEFTRRAFLNGKMDLTAVEGLADLIDAQTEAQRRQAIRQLDGALARWAEDCRSRLLQGLAAAESAIDFADEGDVAGDFLAEVHHIAQELHASITEELRRFDFTARIREGLTVAIAGPPNAGKSTLLNALARRDVAIVSPHAGTTRDLIEVELDLGGFLVTCVDTAGLRISDDPIELEGMARARKRARQADLVLWLSDARSPSTPDPQLADGPLCLIATHSDLIDEVPACDFAIAPPTGQGLPELIAALRDFAGAGAMGQGDGLVTRLRHRVALDRARSALLPLTRPADPLGIELAAEHLREATAALDSLIGRVAPDDILGEIFERFCIGK